MAQCARCGLDGSKTRLLIAISDEGMIPICESCNVHEELPVIRRPTTYQLKEAERPTSVYNRLANMAKLNPVEHRQKLNIPERQERALSKTGVASTRETSLRELVDKKYKEKQLQPVKKDTPLNLVDNFHWAIKMVRRARKLSVAQLAKEIGESEAVIEMVERGVLPEDDFRIINKLETFFKIKLLKDKENVRYFPNTSGLKKQGAQKELPKEINFDDKNVRNLKIEDLKKIKEEKETASGENESDIEIEEDIKDSGESISEGESVGEGGEQPKKGWKFWK